jgi:hypothetical protein
LDVPEPAPVGAIVDPLGEALGPREFPDGLCVLFGAVVEAPLLPVVLPFEDEPIVAPVAAEPLGEEPGPAVPACASAKVLESANTVASAIVLSFMDVSLVIDRG